MINNPVYAVIATGIALVCVWQLSKWLPLTESQDSRVSSLDGLRGYLAFGVFLHHSVIWFYWLRTGAWSVPPSNLFTHLGQSSVALFFMITGFLFFSKILQSRSRPIDWLHLFVARLLRLGPMYLFAVSAMVLLVMMASDWQLLVTIADLTKSLLRWLSFSILGTPDVNLVARTRYILAGVTWTLPYEWLFYLSLPVIAFLTRASTPLGWLSFSITSMLAIMMVWTPDLIQLLCFAGGMASALVLRNPSVQLRLRNRPASFVALGSLLFLATFFPTAEGLPQVLLLSCAFMIFASGNTFFGILNRRVSAFLGEITYSVYLLHGIVLYVMFTHVLGKSVAASLTPLQHWLCVLASVPALIFLCTLTYLWIEVPAIKSSRPIATRIARRFGSSQ